MISRFSSITQTNTKPLHQQQSKNQNNNNPSFKGPVDSAVQAGTQALNFLNTSPAIGACFVDFFSMVLPRTLVDFSRSKDAGMETGFREGAGTVNHAVAGVVGLGAGYAVSSAFNKANGVKAHLMFMDSSTIDTFKDFVKISTEKTGYNSEKYWKEFFKNLEGHNTTNGEKVWKSLSEKTIDDLTKIMAESGAKTYKVPENTMAKVSELITGETGAGSTFRLVLNKEVEGSAKDLVGNANSMLKAVVDKAKYDKTAIVEDLEKFLKGVKNRKLATVAAGLAIPIAIGMSAQPFNRYLTKKRTGSDGFVGVEGREPDHTKAFKFAKIVLGLAMGSAMISTILKNPSKLYTNIKEAGPEILSKLQYKGVVPTMNQFKFIYGMTIMSRIFAARDKNEMRESAIKDSLGFANWLILGGFVSKLAAKAFNKGIVNYSEKEHGKGLWNYITKSVEKTHEEILYPTLKKMGISVLDEKGKQLSFRKLINLMAEKAKTPEVSSEIKTLAKETASKLKYKNYAQLLGYIYSGVVLGVGIPKLNIAITKHYEKKAAAKKAAASPADKMKINNEFIIMSQKNSKDSKTFGAFLNQI